MYKSKLLAGVHAAVVRKPCYQLVLGAEGKLVAAAGQLSCDLVAAGD